MTPSGKGYKWPTPADEDWQPVEKVCRKLAAPTLLNSQAQFKFDEL